jgi:hypothetical protein
LDSVDKEISNKITGHKFLSDWWWGWKIAYS